ncbi:MAG: hypothetical protein M3Z36_08215, partial [Acidobacteriota bacterium]|nr:hypothetical protein [Acidobacteriota bacterium]
VEHIVVTHAMLAPSLMPIADMQQAAKLGAYIEFVYNALIGPNKMFEIKQYVEAMRQIGPDSCIVSSDLGQAGNPLHPDGLIKFLSELKDHGLSLGEIDKMAKTNPAKLLGLPQ